MRTYTTEWLWCGSLMHHRLFHVKGRPPNTYLQLRPDCLCSFPAHNYSA